MSKTHALIQKSSVSDFTNSITPIITVKKTINPIPREEYSFFGIKLERSSKHVGAGDGSTKPSEPKQPAQSASVVSRQFDRPIAVEKSLTSMPNPITLTVRSSAKNCRQSIKASNFAPLSSKKKPSLPLLPIGHQLPVNSTRSSNHFFDTKESRLLADVPENDPVFEEKSQPRPVKPPRKINANLVVSSISVPVRTTTAVDSSLFQEQTATRLKPAASVANFLSQNSRLSIGPVGRLTHFGDVKPDLKAQENFTRIRNEWVKRAKALESLLWTVGSPQIHGK